MFLKRNKADSKKVLIALESGSKSVVPIVCTCACAGIIVGVLSITGLGTKLSTSLIKIAKIFILVV